MTPATLVSVVAAALVAAVVVVVLAVVVVIGARVEDRGTAVASAALVDVGIVNVPAKVVIM
jgi:archaellum component FlaG (FlaF/FlaG flagellin family)